MRRVMKECDTVLKPGGYAVFVVGDAVFKAEVFSTADAIATAAEEAGFDYVGRIERAIHLTKRSFVQAARRARTEHLVVLRKPANKVALTLMPPAYRMWSYEVALRQLETEAIFGKTRGHYTDPVQLKATPKQLAAVRKLTFTKEYLIGGKGGSPQPTWQKILENGDGDAAKRKDPKYVTHGVHPYKGKFYPQLAKSLMNISGAADGARILDPYCGSGTVLLEGMLNGYATYGCDFNPLAAKIARAKTGILSVDRDVAEHALVSLAARLKRPPKNLPTTRLQFAEEVRGELGSWFAPPVLNQLEWLLAQSRLFGDPRIVEFCEIVVSSIIRDVSQQDPTDLQIRRRKEPLLDAPVIDLVVDRLETQLQRLIKYWSVAGRQPGERIAAVIQTGDSRDITTYAAMGLKAGTIDCVVTSPPYATALPYIDTDRLSLMAIMGISSSTRSDLEVNLTGSREIKRTIKSAWRKSCSELPLQQNFLSQS